MKSDKNILIAFVLNLIFSLFEFVGGFITGSVAIASDALHDLGDAASIGVSYFLERKSQKSADNQYTFGYGRYSVLGGLITSMVLLLGSIAVIINAAIRLHNPVTVNYNGMIVFAIIGIAVNFIAAYITRDGRSVNQKAVNLHMIEDVMGWIAVLIGATVMHFTDWTWIDPVLSILVALTIWYGALINVMQICNILTEKAPNEVNVSALKQKIATLHSIDSVDTLKVWSINSSELYAIVHITTETPEIKNEVRRILAEYNIGQSTIECNDDGTINPTFTVQHPQNCGCGHHHHAHFPRIPIKKQ